jgi:hypothetical protein
MPHTEYNESEVEGHKQQIQEILGTVNAPSLLHPDEDCNAHERTPHRASAYSHTTAMTSVSESGMPLARFHQFCAER